MPKLTIDGKLIEVEEGLSVMQACELAGIEIPHFCFHEKLNIAGNCRMCLVEAEKSPKPIASCAMPANDGMVIHTNTSVVKKAREGVLELLLINHPLDCPICDEGGECDLQDQVFKYGRGFSRYHENKRSVKDKNFGPLIKTHMTRCIHCTRCVRFMTEIAGSPELGSIGRGEHTEITGYLEKALSSELSGNIIDLCPVGALTSKPYAFTARSWELEHTESIDVMDALGSNIRIDSRGLEVMRILPKINEEINEEWLSDKARFSYDGLKYQRLDRAYLKKKGKLEEVSWTEAVKVAAEKISSLKGDEIASIAGTTVCAESMYLLKKLLAHLGSSNIDANQFGYKLDISARGNYLFNTRVAGIEEADLCLLVGANPRIASPVLNSRIHKTVKAGKLKVWRIGEIDDQTYPINELGNNADILDKIINNFHEFSKELKKAKKPIIIVGDSLLAREDGHALLSKIHEILSIFNVIRPDWNGFNILHNHASIVGALDVGFIFGTTGNGTADILRRTREGKIKLLYLLAADEIDMNDIGTDTFVIYQGHHGDKGASKADLIFPAAAYTEQDATYVNLEGRPQRARRAVQPPGKALENWLIINNLAEELNFPFLFKNLNELRKEMERDIPHLSRIDEVLPSEFIPFNSSLKLSKNPITTIKTNYYMTDPISRASVTMARCSKARKEIEEAA